MGGPAAIPGHPRKGQDGPCSPRSCARADSTSSPGGGAGQDIPSGAQAPAQCPSRPGALQPLWNPAGPPGLGAKEGNAPGREGAASVRESPCSQRGEQRSRATSGSRNSDLGQGNPGFPQHCVVRAWLIENWEFYIQSLHFITIKLSESQWVLSDKRFNSFWHVLNFLFLLQGFFWFGFVLFFLSPQPPQSGFSILLLCKLLSIFY